MLEKKTTIIILKESVNSALFANYKILIFSQNIDRFGIKFLKYLELPNEIISQVD